MNRLASSRSILAASCLLFLACGSEAGCDSARHEGSGESTVQRSTERDAEDSPPVAVESQDHPSTASRKLLDPAGRGPSGQWPPGFPAYRTSADLVTNGSDSGLSDALDSRTCSNGCVIEHPADFESTVLTRRGTGEIVIRPPLGKRADYEIRDANIRASNLLIAGYALSGGARVTLGSNSGYAWLEDDAGGSKLMAIGYGGDITSAIFYEIVFRRYAPEGRLDDRGTIQANKDGRADMLIVGSVITGDPSTPPAHADTLQVYNASGGTGKVTIRDSVIWPSWDKAYQGQNEDLTFINDNVWIASPAMASSLWSGPGSIDFSQPFHTTAVAEFRNSTVHGEAHPGHVVKVWDSKLYMFKAFADMGGNRNLRAPEEPPPVPTHQQLDAIWSP